MTREAAACNASAANLYSCQQNLHSCQQTQTRLRARDTITNNVHCRLPPDKMLLGLRTILRNARQGPKRIGDMYRGPESSLRCTGCASNVFSEASYSTYGHQSPASGSSLQDDGRRMAGAFGSLSRHFSSWARDEMGSGDQFRRNVAAHARARGRGSLASADVKQVGSGTSRVKSSTLDGHEILRAAEEERVSSFASDGSAEGKATMADEEVSGVSADLRDENRPIKETGVESVGSVPGISGGGGSPEETSLHDLKERGPGVVNASDECGSAVDASTSNTENLQSNADSLSAELGVSELDLNLKPAKPKNSSVSEAPARKGKVGKGAVAGTKVSSEMPSGRGKPASAEKSKKDSVTDPVKSKVFKETGRRPLSTAARVSAEERRKKEEMKQLPATDLLTVKGIGPTYVGRFMEQGYKSVKDLEDLYKEKFYKKSEGMVAFLQTDIGVKQSLWAKSIVDHIEKPILEGEKEDASTAESEGPEATRKKPLTFCVEGNISVGKSTFLRQIVSKTFLLKELVDISPEPVEKWQSVGSAQHNILDSFYRDPHRFAYTFQSYVFITRMQQAQERSDNARPLRLMERSVFSDRMVFVRAVHEAKFMSDMEISIYDSWFDPIINAIPTLVPDGFIYLRANPATCFNRLKKRARAEEDKVDLDYLQNLHEKHEKWLIPPEAQSSGHSLMRGFNMDSFPELIRDSVYSLRNNDVHPRIMGVPALVLDCDPDIDIVNDQETKDKYAAKVNSFYDYIKKNKLEPGSDAHIIQPSPQEAQEILNNSAFMKYGGFPGDLRAEQKYGAMANV